MSGHKNIIRIFWVKLFVARFWSDCKEWEAVCVKYFCEKFRFGNEGNRGGSVGRNVAGALSKPAAFWETKIAAPSNSMRGVTEFRCGAKGLPTRPVPSAVTLIVS